MHGGAVTKTILRPLAQQAPRSRPQVAETSESAGKQAAMDGIPLSDVLMEDKLVLFFVGLMLAGGIAGLGGNGVGTLWC